MKKLTKKNITALLITLSLVMSFAGCSVGNTSSDNNTTTPTTSNNSSDNNTSVKVTNTSSQSDNDMFTSRDKEVGYDETTAIKITLADNKSTSSDSSVTVNGNTLTITKEGTYVLSGTLTNGQIIVDTDTSEKVQLVLNGVNINCETSSAIYVKQADKVFITLAKGSNNTLSNTKEFVNNNDEEIDAVIYAKDDITFNGSGKLTVNAQYGHGIVSKDDLVFTSGTYTITAQNHALSGKDSVRIANGTFTLTAGKDGIHSENTKDNEKGYVYIENGTFKIKSDGDGIDASLTCNIVNGNIDITSGGGSANATQKQDKDMMFGGNFNQNTMTTTDTDDNTTSAKGIKADGDITIAGGTFNINASDDALHANNNVNITQGTLSIATGDDGVHADNNTAISGGSINISKSYEGIEGHTIEISGGDITLYATDDGINSAGGNDQSGFGGNMKQDMFASDDNAYIKISGGKIVVNADGDGLDSNGNLYVSGGETYVNGPTNNGNGALDYNGDAQITGGIFVAVGASGMAQNFGSNSTQGSIMVNTSSADTSGDVTLKDSSGKTLLTFSPSKTYNSVVISTPDIQKGNTYTVNANGTDTQVEMTDIIYGSSNGMGMGGGMHGGMQDRMGAMPENGMNGNPPDGNNTDSNFNGGMRGRMKPDNQNDNMQMPDNNQTTKDNTTTV